MGKKKKVYRLYKDTLYRTRTIDQQNILSIMEKADDFEKIIDKKVDQFKRQGVSIDICAEYFDDMISEYIAKLMAELEAEHAQNMCDINDIFRSRVSAKIEMEEFLNRLEMEISVTEIEYESLKKIIDELDPLRNGKLIAGKTAKTTKEEVENEQNKGENR